MIFKTILLIFVGIPQDLTSILLELDGGQHLIDQEKDNQRTARLEARGFRVLRFWNHEVLQSTEAVLASIHSALSLP